MKKQVKRLMTVTGLSLALSFSMVLPAMALLAAIAVPEPIETLWAI